MVVALLSLLVPISNLTRGEYQSAALLALLAYSPLLLIVNRTWFRVIVGIFLVIWSFYLLGAIFWGGPSLFYLLLPIPLVISLFLPPAPADRRTFLTIAGSGAVSMLLFASTILAISANEGGILYLCADGPVDASVLNEVNQEDPRGGYRLPDGVTTMRSTSGGYAFHFAPFTRPERDALISRAAQTDWVTDIRIDQPCAA